MLSLCFASIQAMDPDPNHEIDRLVSDILNNDIIRVQTTLESNPQLAHAHSSSLYMNGPPIYIDTPSMLTLAAKEGKPRNSYTASEIWT